MRNAWVICRQVEDNQSKGWLILNVIVPLLRYYSKAGIRKDLSLDEKPASYQLVDEVTAHQGYDG